MYYYDKKTKECHSFLYGGCKGNENRFSTLKICEQRCIVNILPPGQTKPTDSTEEVESTMEPGGTPSKLPRKTFNNFLYLYNLVFFYKHNIFLGECTLPKEAGPCNNYETMYYYDRNMYMCRMFAYGGCQGNDNRFNTFEECQQRCVDIAIYPPGGENKLTTIEPGRTPPIGGSTMEPGATPSPLPSNF